MDRLGPNVTLELAGSSPLLSYRREAGESPLPPLSLHPLLAAILAMFDAGDGPEAISERLASRLHQPLSALRETVDDAALCFKAHFKHRGRASFVALDPEPLIAEVERRGAPIRSREIVFPNDRTPFPLTLQWLVTRYCNRRCVYCYAGAIASSTARDADLPFSRIAEILREGARLGSYNFFLTGGEPLLRPDAFDALALALRLGMEPLVISKQFIPEAAARQLAEAGLPEIFLSIDSLDQAEAQALTGVRTFAREIAKTVERLVRNGIRVRVKSVLTTRNVEHLRESLEALDVLGASDVRIDVYSANLQRHDDALRPSPDELARAAREVERFLAEGRRLRVSFDHLESAPPPPPWRDPAVDCFICHNGFTSLLFLPDGRVSRCDKQLPGDEMIVGDLQTASVHEVWNSPAMLGSLLPPRELYRDTACFGCNYFQVCHQRGRCYYDAYLTSGTLYGPQSTCFYRKQDAPVIVC